jgi:serine/threonine-protein kinase
MSPEQAAGETQRVGSRSDVYGVGATLFTIASGRLVHDEKSPPMLTIRAATTPAPSLATVMVEAPKSFVEVVDRALQFDPKQRWGSAAEMRDALRAVYVSLYGPLPSAVPLPALTGLAWFRPEPDRSLSNLTTSVPVAVADPPSQAPAAVAARTSAPPLRRWSRRWIVRRTLGIAFVAAVASSLTYVSVRRYDDAPPPAAIAPPSVVTMPAGSSAPEVQPPAPVPASSSPSATVPAARGGLAGSPAESERASARAGARPGTSSGAYGAEAR